MGAFQQSVIPRWLAYGSTGHIAFGLGALSLGSALALAAGFIDLLLYVAAALLIFAFLGGHFVLHGPEIRSRMMTASLNEVLELRGLAFTFPACLTMTVASLSLAGLPPLAGFAGKLGVLSSLMAAGQA